jgi:hypothetical protein
MRTWRVWLTICPALGFPWWGRPPWETRPASGDRPKLWVAWVTMIAAVVVAIAVFVILAPRGVGP